MYQLGVLLVTVLLPAAGEGNLLSDVTNLGSSFVQTGLQTWVHLTQSPDDQIINKEMFYTMFDFASVNGYAIENYYATTEDGYILQLFRIARGREPSNGVTVFLQHGVGCTSELWVSEGPKNSLGFFLADQGYDVWMGNFRGSYYSRNHTTINPNDKAFWDFSYDQNGYYDLPTMIDFVLKKTNKPKLMLIAYSMGTKAVMIMLATKPEYNAKLLGYIALASATSTAYGLPIEKAATFNNRFIQQGVVMFTKTGFTGENGQRTDLARWMYLTFCPPEHPAICYYILQAIFGVFTDELVDKHRISLLVNQIRTGGSYRQTLQYFQASFTKTFTKYDFGPNTNKQLYNQTDPPKYNLSNIVVPTVMIWGDNDVFACPLDVAWLQTQLPNVVASIEVDHLLFNHLTFFSSKLSYKLLFPHIADSMTTLLSISKDK